MTEEKLEAWKGAMEGDLCGDKVVVSSQHDADSLAQAGFGERVEKTKLALELHEALYLVAEKRLKVSIDEASADLPRLVGEFKRLDCEIWEKYILYRDLRSRGYVVREGSIQGADFRVFERGCYPGKAKYEVFPVREGNPVAVRRLNDVLRSAEAAKKKLIIAVVDRHGDIVYYSVTDYKPS